MWNICAAKENNQVEVVFSVENEAVAEAVVEALNERGLNGFHGWFYCDSVTSIIPNPEVTLDRIFYSGEYQAPAEKYTELQYHQYRWNHATSSPEYVDSRTGQVIKNPWLDPQWRFKYQLQSLKEDQQKLYRWNPDHGDAEQGYGWWQVPESVQQTHELQPDGRWLPK